MSKAWRRKLRKTLYFQYFKFQKGQNSRKNWQEFMTLKLDRIFIRRNWHAKFQLNMSKHVGEKCGKLTDRRRPGWRPGRTDRRTSPYHNTRRLKTVFNKSPKGHWSLTWVQWALLLKVRFLSKWLITQKAWLPILFLKSVRKANNRDISIQDTTMHSVCCCCIHIWRRSLLEKGPLIDLFCAALDPSLGGSGRKA